MADAVSRRRYTRFIDLTGQTFGRLVVRGRAERAGYWSCDCICGGSKDIHGTSLRCEHTRSCGCLQTEARCANGKATATHGHARPGRRTPEYRSWSAMIRRCYAPNCSDFANYGKRGITVCKRWRNSFPNFLADMGQRPSRRHTLERKNNSLGYMLNNCIWADDIAQNNNTRRNRKLTVGDRTLSISQWAREYGMPPTTLRQRIVAYGWDFERAVSTPIDARKANRRKR